MKLISVLISLELVLPACPGLLCPRPRGAARGQSKMHSGGQHMPACTLAQQAKMGRWDLKQRTFTPVAGCRARLLTPDAASRCLKGRTLLFMGDSMIRNFGVGMASFLSGVAALNASRTHLSCADVENRHALWDAQRPERNRSGTGMLAHLLSPQGYTDTRDKWRIRVLHRSYHQYWPLFHALAENARPDDLVFVSIGMHDTQRIRVQNNWRHNATRYFVHGEVFQPFLDHQCEAVRHPRGAPLIWMSANDQCGNLKPSRWANQVGAMQKANSAAAAASSSLRFPMLDWRGVLGNATLRCVGNESLSADGVHVREWVDHARAQLLASYLCAEDDTHGEPIYDPKGIDRVMHSHFQPASDTCSPCKWPNASQGWDGNLSQTKCLRWERIAGGLDDEGIDESKAHDR